MVKQVIYTISTGHNGTTFLAELFKKNLSESAVYHERIGYLTFGIETPDISHFTHFNSVGNVPRVRHFWQQKLQRNMQEPVSTYVETSHLLVKAGLCENLDLIDPSVEVNFIILRRDLIKTIWSFVQRFDFSNLFLIWSSSLDPKYPNKIVDETEFVKHGMFGNIIWYIYEMLTRMEYYQLLLLDKPNVHFYEVNLEEITNQAGAFQLLKTLGHHQREEKDIIIPDQVNAVKSQLFGDQQKQNLIKLFESIHCDPVRLAKQFYDSGQRLSDPPIKKKYMEAWSKQTSAAK